MPKPRNAENVGLPNRWQYTRSAYYNQVPPGHERYWQHKKKFRLGPTFEEAVATFTRMGRDVSPDDFGLLSRTEIISAARPAEKAGVYFLLRGKRIVYVGRSDSIYARIDVHITAGVMDFDSWHVVPCSGFDQERLAQLYIAQFVPDYNIYHTARKPCE